MSKQFASKGDLAEKKTSFTKLSDNAYAFTAESAVLAVEKLAAKRPVGALTPALAFGADFVLEVGGSVRRDHLPDGRG